MRQSLPSPCPFSSHFLILPFLIFWLFLRARVKVKSLKKKKKEKQRYFVFLRAGRPVHPTQRCLFLRFLRAGRPVHPLNVSCFFVSINPGDRWKQQEFFYVLVLCFKILRFHPKGVSVASMNTIFLLLLSCLMIITLERSLLLFTTQGT